MTTRDRPPHLGIATGLQVETFLREQRNEDMTKLTKEQEKRFEEIKGHLSDAVMFLTELADESEAFFEDKSEAWRDGDKGQAYGNWMDHLRNCANSVEDTRDTLEETAVSPE